MSRIGLGRHRAIEGDAGDPLDGLVNLFDVGMILAIAFLIAGLGLALNPKSEQFEARHGGARAGGPAGEERVIPDPGRAPHAAGRGTPVGRVYRLPDGRLVYVAAAAGILPAGVDRTRGSGQGIRSKSGAGAQR